MLNEIQRLRGIACLMVLCQHICLVIPLAAWKECIPSIFHFGSSGVHLFFVISGFVIAMSLGKKLGDCCKSDDFAARLAESESVLKSFFVKRVFRLMPAFILTIFLLLTFHVCFTGSVEEIKGCFKTFFDVISTSYPDCVSNNVLIEKIHFHGTGLFWTISIEILFYALFPVAFLILRDRSQRLKFFLVAGLTTWLCFRWILFHVVKMEDVYYSAFANMDGLLLGSFLGLTYDNSKNTNNKSSVIGCLVSIVFVFGLWCTQSLSHVTDEVRWANTAVFLAAVVVYMASRNMGVLNIFGVNKFLEFLGNRSYSFYIYQMVLAYIVLWVSNSSYLTLSSSETGLLFLLLLLGGTELSYQFVEKPFRKIGNEIASKIEK